MKYISLQLQGSVRVGGWVCLAPLPLIGDPRGAQPREAQRMRRSSRWEQVRRLAWERDYKAKAPCHICGQPINYSVAPSSQPDAYEPDHVIPVSKRPDLELDLLNVAASHARCNRSRGDGTNGENVLGRQSRVW